MRAFFFYRGALVYRILHRIADFLARGLALGGGLVLLVIIVMTCISITGRVFVPFEIEWMMFGQPFKLGPIRGIYDMTEIAMAAAIFAFLPLTQFREAHARVDLFQRVIPKKLDQLLDLLFNVIMTAFAAVGTWRLFLGLQDKLAYGEITLIAQIPVWQGFAAAMVGAVGFVLVSAFCVLRSGRRFAGYED